MIAKEKEGAILRYFHNEKWTVGTIAKHLHLHHTTVQRVLQQSGVEKREVAPRSSMVDPFLEFVRAQLQMHPQLNSRRLFEMVKERGYQGSADHFRRVVSRYRPKPVAEAFQRLKTFAGEQAQVDWAHFGKWKCGQAERPLWAFVMVLSFSRMVFLRFFPGLSTSYFLQGHVQALHFFGGVTRVVLYDNLKSAVLERSGDAIRFHPQMLELSAHYRFEPRPVAVGRGNEKGRVERAIRYIRDAFWSARKFNDLDDLNRQALDWTVNRAAERPWVEDTTQTVAQAFEQEKTHLLPLPNDPFAAWDRQVVHVGKTPYARYDLNDYSVPHDRVRRPLVVLSDLKTVRLLDGTEEVATHPRCWDRRRQVEDPLHLKKLVEEKSRARQHRGLDRLTKSVANAQAFIHTLARQGYNIGHVTSQLLNLLERFGAAELNEALVQGMESERVHLGAVRQLLDLRRSQRGLPPPTTLPISAAAARRDVVVTPHSLACYDQLGKESAQ